MDVYVLRRSREGREGREGVELETLLLRRAPGGRSPGSWEAVHGHIEDEEAPTDAAWREVKEETGLVPARLYNLSRAEWFYLHRADVVVVVPAFAVFVVDGEVTLSAEHDAWQWLPIAEARTRCAWPRIRRALDDIGALLGKGEAGALEDVLRVR